MGCPEPIRINPEIAKILSILDMKIEEYQKVNEKEVKEAKDKQEKQIKERKETLKKLKEKKEEIKEDVIKDLNKKELEIEIDLLSYQVDKMHYIFCIGLELVHPMKQITFDKLIEKSKNAPAIALDAIYRQIEVVKNIPLKEFLYSVFGKVLRDSMEKNGMSATILKNFKNQLIKERGQRRKVEREEFGIEVNEFDDESMDDLKLDLYYLIINEYNPIYKIFRKYARDKMVEAWLGSQ